MIELKHIGKDYGKVAPLRDVNAVINEGDVISIIGPSGCGKSTLLRCLNLLDPPTSGSIFFDGEEITAKGYDTTKVNKRMGMVFQRWNLFAHWDVLDNVTIPQMDLLGRSREEAEAKARELLETVGLSDRIENFPDELSGGQQQRVAIARTLAMDPEVILFDEPTSALDPGMVGEVQAVIQRLARQGRTMLIVTHEMEFARAICNRVFYMDDGGVYEDGTPHQIFESPQREKTRRFIQRLRSVELVFDGAENDFVASSDIIEDFCLRNRLSTRACMKMLRIFEELCASILLPRLSEGEHIKVLIEYSVKNDEGAMVVRYPGKHFDPSTTDDELAWELLCSAIESITHEVVDEGEFTNKATVAFKQHIA